MKRTSGNCAERASGALGSRRLRHRRCTRVSAHSACRPAGFDAAGAGPEGASEAAAEAEAGEDGEASSGSDDGLPPLERNANHNRRIWARHDADEEEEEAEEGAG